MSTTPGMTSGHSFDKRGGVEIAYGVAQRKLDTDSGLDRDLVLDDVPIHMAPEPATSLLVPFAFFSCFAHLLLLLSLPLKAESLVDPEFPGN